ncbi:MAG: TetR/AcrR family transcriptional regulator [Pseudomonadota bacterium]
MPRSGSQKRAELEQVAIAEVQESGLHALSFRTLAERTGIKSSSVHYYFPEKADLANAIVERYREDFDQRLAAIGSRKLGPARQVEAFIDIFEEVVVGGRLCLCGMLAADAARLAESTRTLLRAYFDSAEGWLADLFQTHLARLAPGIPRPAQLASILLAGLEGAILIDRVQDATPSLDAQRALVRSWFA